MRATYCLHKFLCSDVPGMYECEKCTATATYEYQTKVFWIEGE